MIQPLLWIKLRINPRIKTLSGGKVDIAKVVSPWADEIDDRKLREELKKYKDNVQDIETTITNIFDPHIPEPVSNPDSFLNSIMPTTVPKLWRSDVEYWETPEKVIEALKKQRKKHPTKAIYKVTITQWKSELSETIYLLKIGTEKDCTQFTAKIKKAQDHHADKIATQPTIGCISCILALIAAIAGIIAITPSIPKLIKYLTSILDKIGTNHL